MYFGDWLRSSDVVNVWYISFRSGNKNLVESIDAALQRDGRAQKISSTCMLIESTEARKTVVKKLRKVISAEDEVVFLFPHQKQVAYQILAPEEET